MADNPHQEHLVKELTDQLEPVFSRSPQAVYLYLDDEHKICNKKFADLLGYLSPQEWVDNPNPVSDVIAKDRDKVIDAYVKASDQLKASTLVVSMTTKKGQKIAVKVIMTPVTYRGEVFVLHFITKGGDA